LLLLGGFLLGWLWFGYWRFGLGGFELHGFLFHNWDRFLFFKVKLFGLFRFRILLSGPATSL